MRPLKPTIHSRFHIDMSWWKKTGKDWHLYLYQALCPASQKKFSDFSDDKELDYVDPDTGEVKRLPQVWGHLLSCCSRQKNYITLDTPLTMAIFRALLATGNAPLSPVELYQRIRKGSPEMILRVLTGQKIHYGVVPVADKVASPRNSRLSDSRPDS
jgi:hypothetical protein